MMVQPPLSMTPTIPPNRRWIWPFELMEQIGEGGMGVVYRARYVVNNREVAVKMLPSDVSDKVVLARFERELEVLKSLKHPNIVRCFGGVCEDKGRFYAMELVSGGTLENELQRRGRLAWEAVVQYGLQMCSALEWAHQQGVVHRDVKPSNFLITSDGQLKLGDFGLATMAAARKITQAGKTAGTFLYMAPEQIRGQEVTRRTDLYALGCVFFELLTGRPPFTGDTPAATLHMHLKSPAPRVSQLALDCPAALDQIVSKLMEKSPADRFDSAEEVSRVLRTVTPTITVRSPKRSLVVSAHDSNAETISRDVVRQPRVRRAPPIPFWVTSILSVLLAISAVAHVQNRSARQSAEKWEQSWISAVGHPDRNIRAFAVRALGSSPGVTLKGATAISDRLNDPVVDVRVNAALALGDAGAVAKPLLPVLLREKKENTEGLAREAAEQAIRKINDAESPSNWLTWLMAIVLLIVVAAGLGIWYRSIPAVMDPSPDR
jgi:eukaryotic-like serine/threonine-protein kinase